MGSGRYRARSVTAGAASSSPAPPASRCSLLAALAVYAVIAAAAAVAAYLAIFSQFAPYDDEGTLLVTLRAFADGDTLYRDVYSIYGPFYYELFGGLSALSGHSIDTNTSRMLVIVVWIATSLLYGISSQWLTGRLMLGAAGTVVSFGALYVLIGEPMHPQGLCALLLAGFTVLVVLGPGRDARRLGAAAGALLAALMLTKVNLGGFAVAGVALAAAFTLPLPRRFAWLRWPVLVAFLALPPAIAARDLDTGWVRELIAIESSAALALAIAAWPLLPRSGDQRDPLGRWLVAAVAGFAAATVAILVATLLTGVGTADLYDGVVREAVRVRDVLVTPPPLSRFVLAAAILAMLAAGIMVRFGSTWERQGPWLGLLRVGAGLAIWIALARQLPDALGTVARNPDALPLVLAWLAAIPVAGLREPAFKRFMRVLFPALAIAGALQVYPVAGSQLGIAAVSFVPVGALCIADGLASLRAWSGARGGWVDERFNLVGVATVAVVAALGAVAIVRPTIDNARAFDAHRSLPFPGAGMLRLPASEVEAYTRLVGLLHANRCATFIGYPNIDSLYLWSGIEPPPPAAPGAWIRALDSERQQRVVDELRASPRPCAIRSYGRAGLWLHDSPPPDRPLVRYIRDEFEPVSTVGEFEFLLPKSTPLRVR